MVIDVVKMVDAWVSNPTHGVAAGLAAVPISAGVTRATAPTVFNEADHEEASRLQAPDTLPALVINSSGTLQQTTPAVRPFPADTEVELVLRHIVRDHETDDALSVLMQGQRAVQRTMARMFVVAGNEAARTRNGVQIYSLRSYRGELYRGNEDSILTMAHTYTFAVRDTWALS